MSRSYWLFHQSIRKHRVCQKIFCNTFDISTSIINICSKNRGHAGSYVGTDNRKGKIPANITSLGYEICERAILTSTLELSLTIVAKTPKNYI